MGVEWKDRALAGARSFRVRLPHTYLVVATLVAASVNARFCVRTVTLLARSLRYLCTFTPGSPARASTASFDRMNS